MSILAILILILLYFAFASTRFVEALARFYDNRFHGALLALMLIIPYVLVALPTANANLTGFGLGLLKMVAYLLFPTLLLIFKPKGHPALDLYDILAVLGLWFPIEFDWLPQADAVLGSVSIPIPLLTAIVLGYLLFIVIRPLEMGYSYQLRGRDLLAAVQAWGAFAIIGIPLGVAMGFIVWRFAPFNAGDWLLRLTMIYFLNALPEEMLFRGVIQNMIERRFGRTWQTLMVAALIFGLAHVDNATAHHAVPNWPYVIMASFAGIAYGWAWRKSGKITGSAVTHTLVNFMWGAIFKG